MRYLTLILLKTAHSTETTSAARYYIKTAIEYEAEL